MSLYKRPISPNEWVCMAFQKIYPPFGVQVLVEGVGDVEIKKLKEAVEKTSESCPGCRLVAKGKEWVDSNIAPPVIEYYLDKFDGYNFEILNFLKKGLNYDKGPTCDVMLINSGITKTIIFRAFHGVMDGIGVITWAGEVFKTLRGESNCNINSTLIEVDIVNDKGSKKLEFQNSELKMYSNLFENKKQLRNYYLWKRFRISNNTNFIAAKLMALIIEFSQNDELKFIIPVDLRRYYPELKSTNNLTLSLYIEVKKGETWEYIQQKIVKQIINRNDLNLNNAEKLLDLPRWIVWLITLYLEYYQIFKRKSFTSAMISNFMQVNLEAFSTDSFSAKSVYALPLYAGLTLAVNVVECGDFAEVCFSYPNNVKTKQKVEELINFIEQFFNSC